MKERGAEGKYWARSSSDLKPCASFFQFWGKRNALLPLPHQDNFNCGFIYWPSLKCKGLTEMPKNPLARMMKRGGKKPWKPVGKQEARRDINSWRETSDGHTVAPKSWLSGHRRSPGLWPSWAPGTGHHGLGSRKVCLKHSSKFLWEHPHLRKSPERETKAGDEQIQCLYCWSLTERHEMSDLWQLQGTVFDTDKAFFFNCVPYSLLLVIIP